MSPETLQPLAADETARLIDFARACKAAARAVLLYPAGHPAIAATLGVVVVALFLFAAFIPWVRTWWFDWLGGLTVQWEAGRLAWVWLVVAAFILLPSLAFLGRAVPRPGRRERRAGKRQG